MADPTGHNTPTEPPPAGAPGDFHEVMFDTTPAPLLAQFLAALGLTGPEFAALPATHLEFLGRQLLRSKSEETRCIGELSVESLADGSVHISTTLPPGALGRLNAQLATAAGLLLNPEFAATIQAAVGRFGGSTQPEPLKRKRRARKTPAPTTPPAGTAGPIPGGQAPLDLGASK